jgi:hypothetical protein
MLGFAIGIFFVVAAISAIFSIVHTVALVRVALRELRQERDAAIQDWALMDALRANLPHRDDMPQRDALPQRDAMPPERSPTRMRPPRAARAQQRQHLVPAHAPIPKSLAENM